MARAAWHNGLYRKLAPLVVARADANPATLCLTCRQPARAGDPWQAGHVIDGKIITSVNDLAAEHRSCNASKGATRGNRMRTQGVTRQW